MTIALAIAVAWLLAGAIVNIIEADPYDRMHEALNAFLVPLRPFVMAAASLYVRAPKAILKARKKTIDALHVICWRIDGTAGLRRLFGCPNKWALEAVASRLAVRWDLPGCPECAVRYPYHESECTILEELAIEHAVKVGYYR